MHHDLPVAIAIPVHNRASRIGAAVRAALDQSHPDCVTIVVDDGSSDGTWDALLRMPTDPRLALIRLRRNLGSGQAKNVAMALSGCRAITFHDSDDRPHPDKLLRQARVLASPAVTPDTGQNWGSVRLSDPAPLPVSAVFSHHDLILPDGRKTTIRRELSLLDDMFPNAMPQPAIEGEWLHINSGLFAPEVFRDLGGYQDSVEEDRDLRNRLLCAGRLLRVIEDPLLTKIETSDSLTQSPATGYRSARRMADRQAIWRDLDLWRATGEVAIRPITLPEDAIAVIVNPALLQPSPALMSAETAAMIRRALQASRLDAVPRI